jgi:hypothetical protein
MKDENSRLTTPAGQKPGEAAHHPEKTDSESWRPVRLNSDGPADRLHSQITWFLFVALQLFLTVL